ncbi:MAG: beta-galactosidase [Rariglobus sp.]|nr:beta-galactosidase [Rariglobus sp.]
MKPPSLLIPLLASMLIASSIPAAPAAEAKHSFTIGEQDFLLDGKPFVIRCGEIHFPRVPREYWKHRLQMCRAMGLNTVCVYLFWNFHEWEQGKYNWSGQADVAEFCRLAQAEGLWVILRPGPYSCAEWEMGGLPWWLVKHDGIALRSTDPRFLEPATRFLKEVGRMLGPQQVTRGGPLLMVQVENEYGSFGKDAAYMGAIRQALLDGGFNVPLFACNPAGAIANGHRDDLFQVVNFGTGTAKKSFETLRRFQKTGPLMNGEYYPAWFDTWGRAHRTGASAPIAADLDYMLKHRHSFSIYMAHGGTSFGLWAGADRPFVPDTSSYDYDAPVSEAGWITPKFGAIRDVFSRHLQAGETLPAPPPANPVVTIPSFTLSETAPVLGNLPAPVADTTPRTMEFYDQSRGVIAYRTQLPAGPAGTLSVKAAHDFAWVFLDGRPAGVMDRRSKRYRITLPARTAATRLDIVVEAMGRVNFGTEVFDRKGLHAPVLFTPSVAGSAVELKNWLVYPLPLESTQLSSLKFEPAIAPVLARPAFWRGTFRLTVPGDTFLDVRSWGKGVVWINGHCLGRFWNIGPTQTMYMPGPWLRAGSNEVVVLDMLGPQRPELAGLDKPILDELRPELDFARSARAHGRFNTTGLTPASAGQLRPEPEWQAVRFTQPATGRYLAFEALDAHDGKPFATVAELDVTDSRGEVLSKSTWKILWVDSEEFTAEPGHAENMLDGQPNTHWHSAYGSGAPSGYPHRVVLDLGETQTLGGFRYLSRSGDNNRPGRIKSYQVYLSERPFGLAPAP